MLLPACRRLFVVIAIAAPWMAHAQVDWSGLMMTEAQGSVMVEETRDNSHMSADGGKPSHSASNAEKCAFLARNESGLDAHRRARVRELCAPYRR